eukprot:TRINITY_DN5981_c0_g1_i2.p2 TRINITY_DN5981_c0_g1~~TRINITY_DN5981_c0_g1_i2.p2  ORF type:complete len:119 (-),score=9.41 TRINITY_DN5981_c0_g1_i2:25-381(-)
MGRMVGPVQFSYNTTGRFGSLEQLLSHIMETYDGPVGNPPAAAAAIESLPEVAQQDESQACSVCKDAFVKGELAVQLPCNHFYHKDCLFPWLQQHNTCPTCRYELPTDDMEYERRRCP